MCALGKRIKGKNFLTSTYFLNGIFGTEAVINQGDYMQCPGAVPQQSEQWLTVELKAVEKTCC